MAAQLKKRLASGWKRVGCNSLITRSEAVTPCQPATTARRAPCPVGSPGCTTRGSCALSARRTRGLTNNVEMLVREVEHVFRDWKNCDGRCHLGFSPAPASCGGYRLSS